MVGVLRDIWCVLCVVFCVLRDIWCLLFGVLCDIWLVLRDV